MSIGETLVRLRNRIEEIRFSEREINLMKVGVEMTLESLATPHTSPKMIDGYTVYEVRWMNDDVFLVCLKDDELLVMDLTEAINRTAKDEELLEALRDATEERTRYI